MQFGPSFKFIVYPNEYRTAERLLILKEENGEQFAAVVTWRKLGEFDMVSPDEGISLPPMQGLQALAEVLAEKGYVSRETAGELKATKGWLEDMRTLALKKAAAR